MKSDEIRGRQERVEALLDRMNEREYGNLVFLSKEIDDFDATIIVCVFLNHFHSMSFLEVLE